MTPTGVPSLPRRRSHKRSLMMPGAPQTFSWPPQPTSWASQMSGEPQTFGWPPQPTSGATQPIPGFAAPGFAASLVSTLGATTGCRACAGRHVAHTCPKRRPKKRALTELPTNEAAKRRDTLVSTTAGESATISPSTAR